MTLTRGLTCSHPTPAMLAQGDCVVKGLDYVVRCPVPSDVSLSQYGKTNQKKEKKEKEVM